MAQVDLSNSKSKQVKVDPEEILQKVYLSWITDWDTAEQQEACELICEYPCIFSQNFKFKFGKDINGQTFDQIDRLNTIQGMLPMYSSGNV